MPKKQYVAKELADFISLLRNEMSVKIQKQLAFMEANFGNLFQQKKDKCLEHNPLKMQLSYFTGVFPKKKFTENTNGQYIMK